MKQRDKKELEIYRKLAEINGRLEALRAVEAIEEDLRRRFVASAPPADIWSEGLGSG